MDQELKTIKLPKPPTFFGGFSYIVAGFLFTVVGVGLLIIGPPSYYPRAVWYTISIIYPVIGAVSFGLGYRYLKRFFHYQETIQQTETGDTAEAEHQTETLAEKRP